jgi:hypothetical protein
MNAYTYIHIYIPLICIEALALFIKFPPNNSIHIYHINNIYIYTYIQKDTYIYTHTYTYIPLICIEALALFIKFPLSCFLGVTGDFPF